MSVWPKALAIVGIMGVAIAAQTRAPFRTVAAGNTLVQESDVTYEGAFKVPDQSGGSCAASMGGLCTIAYGGKAMAWDAGGDGGGGSLYISAHFSSHDGVVEVRVPSGLDPADTLLSQLPSATILSGYGKITDGHISDVAGCGSYGILGMKLINSTDMLIMGGVDGCTSAVPDQKSAAIVKKDINSPAFVGGFYGISRDGRTTACTTYPDCAAPAYNGSITDVPSAWQSALGGDTMSGNCCFTTSTLPSDGPSLTTYYAANLGTTTTTEGYNILYYLEGTHNTLGNNHGEAGSGPHLYTSNNASMGMIWPTDYDGPLTTHGFGDYAQACYGAGTGALDGNGHSYKPALADASGSDASTSSDGLRVTLPNQDTSLLAPANPSWLVWLSSQTLPVLVPGVTGNPGEYGVELWMSKRGFSGASRIVGFGNSGAANAYVDVSDAFPGNLTSQAYVAGENACYDPSNHLGTDSNTSGRVVSAWPYALSFFSYDANDLATAKSSGNHWVPVPQFYWTWETPFTAQTGTRYFGGSTWDPTGRRLFITQQRIDPGAGDTTIILVFSIAAPSPRPLAVPIAATVLTGLAAAFYIRPRKTGVS